MTFNSYALIGSPLLAGAFHDTFNCAWVPTESARATDGAPAASGARAGIIVCDQGLKSDGSGARLWARTRTWYATPFSSPSHVVLLPVMPVFCTTPDGGAGEISSVKLSTGEPSVRGVVQLTVRLRSPKPSVGGAGVSGRTSGRAVSDGIEGSDSPTRLVAVTTKLYSTLFVSPSSVHVVEAHCFV